MRSRFGGLFNWIGARNQDLFVLRAKSTSGVSKKKTRDGCLCDFVDLLCFWVVILRDPCWIQVCTHFCGDFQSAQGNTWWSGGGACDSMWWLVGLFASYARCSICLAVFPSEWLFISNSGNSLYLVFCLFQVCLLQVFLVVGFLAFSGDFFIFSFNFGIKTSGDIIWYYFCE